MIAHVLKHGLYLFNWAYNIVIVIFYHEIMFDSLVIYLNGITRV